MELQLLGMAPLFLAGHQVFTLAMSSFHAVGDNRKLTQGPAWDGVRLKERESSAVPQGNFVESEPVVAPATEMRVRWHGLRCWGWLFCP